MRDKTHDDHIARWATFVREHPTEWKRHLQPFIDSQIIIANRFYENLAKTGEGRKILARLKEERKNRA